MNTKHWKVISFLFIRTTRSFLYPLLMLFIFYLVSISLQCSLHKFKLPKFEQESVRAACNTRGYHAFAVFLVDIMNNVHHIRTVTFSRPAGLRPSKFYKVGKPHYLRASFTLYDSNGHTIEECMCMWLDYYYASHLY